MSFHRRIRTIYGKELVDILRDRRTLIAMIVVPIVLYPLLMLGSIQAVSFQAESMQREQLVIGVISNQQGWQLAHMIASDRAALEEKRAGLDPESEEARSLPEPPEDARTVVFESKTDLEQAVRNREVQVGVIFDRERPIGVDDYDAQVNVEFLADLEEVRSSTAKRRVEALIERVNERMKEARLAREDLPAAFVQPFVTSTVDLSAPPSILGQVLPLILILMTITGAIYPAIDLTAGERERGTLESLMVSPVSVIDLIVGKFLVVTTVAIMGAALNLMSVTATVYFGGFAKVIASTGGEIPLGRMVFILLSLIPFAVLMSAIMIAVCSYARTFKEAQNYVTPVILAVLIPGGIAALPATRLEGVMLVVPVGNMVLLAKDFLLGAMVPVWHIVIVLLSTTLYAGAAVAVAASVFGQESVVFADSGSLRASFSRRLMKASSRPGVSMGLLLVALLFPVWFFTQSMFSPGPGDDASRLLFASGLLMPVLFVVLPVAVLAYWKIDIRAALALRMPAGRHLAAAALIGLSAWVPAHELNILQQRIVGVPQAVLDGAETLARTLRTLPVASVFMLIAVIPAVCEELLFRGFLLSSLSGVGPVTPDRRTGVAAVRADHRARKWTAIVASAVVFGVFHFFVFKFAVTASLGVLLGYLCWEARSVWPAILAHLLHNAIGAAWALFPDGLAWLGAGRDDEWAHLPPLVLIVGGTVFTTGLLMMPAALRINRHARSELQP